jgi:methionine-rich copper-binding protein CopC
MKMPHWICLAALLTSSQALAHSTLIKSEPAHGSVVVVSPAKLVMTFDWDIELISAKVGKFGLTKKRLKKIPHVCGPVQVIELPPLTPGVHEIEWVGLSLDEHVNTGTIRITVAASAPPAASSRAP